MLCLRSISARAKKSDFSTLCFWLFQDDMSSPANIETLIRESVDRVVDNDTFDEWLLDEDPKKNDFIFLNNSFVFRDRVKTKKNSDYLSFRVDIGPEIDKSSLSVGS